MSDHDEEPPTLGVREPRRPSPSSFTGGAAAPLQFSAEPEAEAVALGARVMVGSVAALPSPSTRTPVTKA